MKVITRKIEFKPDFFMNVCCDVHKEELFFFARLAGEEFSDTCENRTKQVENKLKAFYEVAIKKAKKIFCIPTPDTL